MIKPYMNISDYIASGILELYVLGQLSAEEALEVERVAAAYPQVSGEIDAITNTLMEEAEANTKEPHPAVKIFLMAMIDYTERLKNGEAPTFPPQLNEHSQPSDFDQWLNNPAFQVPDDFEHVAARIIGYTPEMQTAILWIRYMAPEEVHHNEYEKFLILEGTCNIIIGDETHSLAPGDYFSIPLHAEHEVRITSVVACKAILQRVAV